MEASSASEDDPHEKLLAAAEDVADKLDNCREAMAIIHATDKQLVECGCYHSLAMLEDQLLNCAASTDTVQALLYIAVVKTEGESGDEFLVRHMEAGSQFKAFIKEEAKDFLLDSLPANSSLFLLPTYTDDDVRKKSSCKSASRHVRSAAQPTKGDTSKKNRSRIGERWKRLVTGEMPRSSSLNSCVLGVQGDMERCHHVVRLAIVARRASPDVTKSEHRFQVAHGFNNNVESLKQLQAKLDDFAIHGVTNNSSCLTHLLECQDMPISPSEQFEMLGCVSNYHWGSRPAHLKSGFTSDQSHVPIVSHYSFTPGWGEEVNGRPSKGHLPNSPRNLLIFYSVSSEANDVKLHGNIIHMVRSVTGNSCPLPNCDMLAFRPRKRQRMSGNLNTQDLPAGTLTHDSNMSDCIDLHLFTSYVQHMTSAEALFYWVVHDDTNDIFIMNDMDAQTGSINPSSVVYVRRFKLQSEIKYTCTCEIYQHVQSTSLSSRKQEMDAAGVSCAHCKYLSEYVESSLGKVGKQGVTHSKLDCILETASQFLNAKVIPVGKHTPQTIAKFSINPGSDVLPSFVHVTRHGFIACKSGECGARVGVTRTIKKLASLQNSNTLCPHLSCIAQHPQDVADVVNQRTPVEDDNNDDDDIFEELDCSGHRLFNVETEKWEIPAFSTHKPMNEGPSLSSCIQARMKFFANDPHYEDGYVVGPKLQPSLPANCACGVGFHATKSEPKDDGTRFVYTRHAAFKCAAVKFICVNGSCSVRYKGEEDGVFFLTTQSGVCDEIGWDFVSRITSSKCSFTSFSTDMSRIYSSNSPEGRSFLSRSTFLAWWFAWIAAFDIDFRKDVDQYCSESRSVLACDGTHVGVSLTNLNVTSVDTPTTPDVVKESMHKRYDRVYLFYPENASKEVQEDTRLARKHLRSLSLEVLGKTTPNNITPYERQQRNAVLLNVCPQENDNKNMLQVFVNDPHVPGPVKLNLARLFHILSGDAAVSAFIPLRFHEHLHSVCDSLWVGMFEQTNTLIDEMYEYCPELADLIHSAKGSDYIHSVIAFTRYLLAFVSQVHAFDLPCDPPVPIPGTYNPESGIAYYFTDHGCRVRDIPAYGLNRSRHGQDLFDDAPVHDDCNKLQAKVSPGGFNYTFFWFCPIHGHCLGFHLMPGAEGRKDPFSSLFAYLPTAPREVFYDFACSFHEYSLNREPGYFKETRFWHDLFHGFSHKCPPSLRSSRIRSLNVLDTEICEQFNAFLQNIKYTGSHLTQSHFCLYLQFMIHIWNSRKDSRWRNIASVAAAVNVPR